MFDIVMETHVYGWFSSMNLKPFLEIENDVAFLTAAEGSDPEASAGVPASSGDTKSPCFVQFQVGNKIYLLYSVYVSALVGIYKY